ncbi:MAG: aminoglycoside phosphotransferase [Pseudonocardia sp. SCN 72-86]|nr:MAG: aminoglycoside phosphotransferase [Pseudonocardia sp. SCN 72-86]
MNGQAPASRYADEVAPVRPGEDLDWTRIETHLRANVPGMTGAFSVLQFPNGSANLTYRIRFGEMLLVLRRPPFGRIALGAHDMRREFRTLSRLWRGYPRAPRGLLFCEDTSVAGAEFLIIEYRPGIVVWDGMPESFLPYSDAGHRVGLAVVDALADLHRTDPAALGLDGLGRPEGFLSRQVTRWTQRWELASGASTSPEVSHLAALLAETLPESGPPALLHNDFKIDNCQFAPGEPDVVTSVFDWDMATLGDPLVDLGTLLNYWPDPEFGDAGALASHNLSRLGLPSRTELIEHYLARSGHDVEQVDWYEAFGCFRTAVILQQLHQRYVAGETQDTRMAAYGHHVEGLAARGLTRLAQL